MGRAVIKGSMVRRRYAQMELSQVVLFGLVLPEPERLMERPASGKSTNLSHRMREIAQGLRRRGERARRAIRKPYRRLLRITGRLVRQAERVAEQARLQPRTM